MVNVNLESLTRFWPLMHSIVQEVLAITEPHIEDAAIRNEIPIELYLYTELGLDALSIPNVQKRDPFTNPEQFEKVFARLHLKGWIEPMLDGSFRATDKALSAVRHILEAGDAQLMDFQSMPEGELKRLELLLRQIVAECKVTPEPPEKWAVLNRFHVANEHYPVIVRIREHLMDLFAYRDDAHLAASRPHFNQAGIVWLALGALWTKEAVTPHQMAEKMTFRGYEASDYEIALQAAVEVGWAEAEERPQLYRLSQQGQALRDEAERLTNEYFYAPWSVLVPQEIEELFLLLTKLHDELNAFRKSQ